MATNQGISAATNASIYEDRIVAFVDILGFTDFLAGGGRPPGGPEGIDFSRYEVVRLALEAGHGQAEVEPDHPSDDRFSVPKLAVTSFSDSTVISTRHHVGAEWRVAKRTCELFVSLLRQGFAGRGGVARGRAYHRGGIVFGHGMLAAHYLESRCASYARIVLGNEVAEPVKRLKPELVDQGSDGLWYLKVFAYILDERDRQGTLTQVGSKLKTRLGEARSRGKPDIVAKWHWLRTRYNEAVDEFNDTLRDDESQIERL